MYQQKTDIELWGAFLESNQDALGALFSRHYSGLYQYGIKICHDQNLVEDCIQELFAEIWRNKASSPSLSVKAYLFKALKYKLYRQLGKPGLLLSMDVEDSKNGLFELSHEHFIIEQIDLDNRAQQVQFAVNNLTSRQKEIIYLKFYQDLSYEEVSSIMNINYQVARNLLYQALKSMKKMIGSLNFLLL